MSDLLLGVRGLAVTFMTAAGPVRAVDDVSLDIAPGEVLALVGESGSGKSVSALTLMGLTRGAGTLIEGEATLGEIDLLGASQAQLRRVRGRQMALVPQNPMGALNPVRRVGDQIAEQVRAHETVTRRAAAERAVGLLEEVGIPEPAARARAFPHELSGGLRQRAVIAMAISCRPRLLIADEPTTALDATVQAQILDLLGRLRSESGTAILLITHDIGAVTELADRVAVMYAGQVLEHAPLAGLLDEPAHPYTWGLLDSVVRLDRPRPRRLRGIAGRPPPPHDPPPGCRFAPRCPHVHERCLTAPPLLGGHRADRCWLTATQKAELRR